MDKEGLLDMCMFALNPPLSCHTTRQALHTSMKAQLNDFRILLLNYLKSK